MQDVVQLPLQVQVLGHILFDEMKPLLLEQVGNVPERPCDQVVHAEDL